MYIGQSISNLQLINIAIMENIYSVPLNLLNIQRANVQLQVRKAYDVYHDQLTNNLIENIEKLQQGNVDSACINQLSQLIRQHREDMVIVRQALQAVIAEMLDSKEHEEMLKRKKLEQARKRLERKNRAKPVIDEEDTEAYGLEVVHEMLDQLNGSAVGSDVNTDDGLKF